MTDEERKTLMEIIASTIRKTVRVPGPAHCSGPAEYFTYNWGECAVAVLEALAERADRVRWGEGR